MILNEYTAAHACRPHDKAPCQWLHICRKKGEKHPGTGKEYQLYAVYCLRGARPKKLGELHSWTGLSLKECPLRQERERFLRELRQAIEEENRT